MKQEQQTSTFAYFEWSSRLMTWERARAGLVGGIVGIAPLLLVALVTKLAWLTGQNGTQAALLALFLGIVLAGGLTGYLAGQGRRRRSEIKAVVGASAGWIAALIFGGALETFFLVRYVAVPPLARDTIIGVHPLRVTFAIIVMSTIILGIAMLTTHLTARPLPPPRPSRRATGQMPAAQPPRQPLRPPSMPGR